MNNRLSTSRRIETVKVNLAPARDGTPVILMYDEHREHIAYVSRANLPGWLALAIDKTPTLFVRARWSGEAWAVIGSHQAAWQSW